MSARWPQPCFAATGTVLLWPSAWIRIMRIPPIEHVWVWGVSLPWPVSGVYSIDLVELLRGLIVLPLVAILLVLTGSFGWARMLRALFISLVLSDRRVGSILVALGVPYLTTIHL